MNLRRTLGSSAAVLALVSLSACSLTSYGPQDEAEPGTPTVKSSQTPGKQSEASARGTGQITSNAVQLTDGEIKLFPTQEFNPNLGPLQIADSAEGPTVFTTGEFDPAAGLLTVTRAPNGASDTRYASFATFKETSMATVEPVKAGNFSWAYAGRVEVPDTGWQPVAGFVAAGKEKAFACEYAGVVEKDESSALKAARALAPKLLEFCESSVANAKK